MNNMGDKYISVNGLGDIIVRSNSRAKRFIFRVRDNQLHMTVPKLASEKEMYQAVSSMYDKLKGLLDKHQNPQINLDFKINTDFFKLHIEEGDRDRFLAKSELGQMIIIAPKGVNFEDEKLQSRLQKVIIEALRRNAKIILPPKLYMFARKHNISYQQIKINTSQGRWGSCSGRKNINLSAYLILLPEHLIDYVILHELSHIEEMNHSKRFWSQLDKLTLGKAKELNEELKNYSTSIFTYQG